MKLLVIIIYDGMVRIRERSGKWIIISRKVLVRYIFELHIHKIHTFVAYIGVVMIRKTA